MVNKQTLSLRKYHISVLCNVLIFPVFVLTFQLVGLSEERTHTQKKKEKKEKKKPTHMRI